MPNPRKPNSTLAVSAGISLGATLKKEITRSAIRRGLRLSSFASQIFTQIVEEDKLTDEAARIAKDGIRSHAHAHPPFRALAGWPAEPEIISKVPKLRTSPAV